MRVAPAAALWACLHRLTRPPPKEPSGDIGQQPRCRADLGQRRPHARGRPLPALLVRRHAAHMQPRRDLPRGRGRARGGRREPIAAGPAA
eukprot:11283793-Alexandrium_andersonii.AAC.1